MQSVYDPPPAVKFLRPRPVPQPEYLNLVHEKFEQREKMDSKSDPQKDISNEGPNLLTAI